MQLKKDFSYGMIPYCRQTGSAPLYFIGYQNHGLGTTGWKFPKGHKEAGETDLETAQRETNEEASIFIAQDNVNTKRVFTEQYVQGHMQKDEPKSRLVRKTNTYYLGCVRNTVRGSEQLNHEFSKGVWLPAEEVAQRLVASSQNFFRKAHSHITD
jgi:8-oxo-dGTP pyrophosphatase MutT (NUDIX family)